MRFTTAILAATTFALAPPVLAQSSGESAGGMSLELNLARDTENGCQVVFRGKNGSSDALSDVEWRIAVFNADAIFEALLALPLGAMPAGKTRILQYNLPFACADLSEIVVNEVAKCTLAAGGESDICLSADVSSRAEIGFGL